MMDWRQALVLSAACGLVGLMTTAQAQPSPAPGDVVFRTDFEAPQDREGWSATPAAHWVELPDRGTCLQVVVPPDQGEGANMISLPLDLTRYRGCWLLLECQARAEEVTRPPAPWLGVKFMLHYKSPTAGPFWRNQDDVYGTFDWQKLQFAAPIAADATDGEICLGLQSSSGTAWFDDISITVLKVPPPPRPPPQENPGPVFRGHNLPRLRGVMSPNEFRDEDLRVLGEEWNANVIRWQITRNWGRAGTDRDLEEYDQWFARELEDLDRVLEACRRYRILVVVDMHSPPGGRYEDSQLAIFHEKLYQDHWLALWEQVARRYKGNPVIWGYDLVNEPVMRLPSREGLGDSLDAQVRVARAIRAIDPHVPIFIEADDWDAPAGFPYLRPVDIPNVIYQLHMYVPGEFTHQGVFSKSDPVAYPGRIAGSHWDKERLREVLQPVRDFQLAYNVHIYVGEFSAIRWAPGAARYLADCISLFEEYGWDWTYHAYREWHGWSLEHGPDPADHQPTSEPCDRREVVLGWFAQNVRPQFAQD